MAYEDQAEIDARNAERAVMAREHHMIHIREMQRRGVLPKNIAIRFEGPDPAEELRKARVHLAELAPN